MQNHLIICGLGHVGYRIIELLHALDVPYAVITRNVRPEWREVAEAQALRFIEGDARSERCLREAGIERARAVLIVTDNDLVNIEIALDVQRIHPTVPLIVRIFDFYLAERAQRAMHVRSVHSPALLTAPVFTAAALGQEMVRAFDFDGHRLHILQLSFPIGMATAGESVEAFCARYDLVPLAVQRGEDEGGKRGPAAGAADDRGSAKKTTPAPASEVAQEVCLRAGDRLLAAASDPATERLRRDGYLPDPRRVSGGWGGRRRAQPLHTSPRSALRHLWQRTPRLLVAVFCALNALCLFSAVLFHYALPGSPSWLDSLYSVVNVMSTEGFGNFDLNHAPGWLKLYGCGMMIAGLTIVAVLFGIITDFIVTARVEQALGQRTTHLRDHVVVIGLGDVGTRVVEELHRIGQPVVAIERTLDHESVPTLQDQVPVIIGDANRSSTLQQANIAQARAVIVTTTNDLDSVRIAHRAERLNPDIRSVIRIYDSSLAQKLGLGLGIDQAVNAAATAAATFVASALQPGVEQGFTLNNRLFALRWITPEGRETEAPPVVVARRPTTGGDKESVLVLEEYFPATHAFGAPQVLL